MKETNLIQSMTNIKKIRLFNNSLLYGNPKVYLDFSLSKKIQQELGVFEKCGKMIAVIK